MLHQDLKLVLLKESANFLIFHPCYSTHHVKLFLLKITACRDYSTRSSSALRTSCARKLPDPRSDSAQYNQIRYIASNSSPGGR